MTPKPMVYHRTHLSPCQVLCLNKYKKYDYFIVNMGTHPTAYVRIPKTHQFYQKNYDYCNPPHGFSGGPFTFGDNASIFQNQLDTEIPNGYYLGWDYAHLGDWLGHWSDEDNIRMGHRKYTTSEIITDCQQIIEYLEENKNVARKWE